MPKALASYDVTDVAKRLVAKNPNLEKVVRSAPDKGQYKALESHISPRLVTKIGRETGQFIPRNKLVWEIINLVNGNDQEALDW
jgi:hypothetical protein